MTYIDKIERDSDRKGAQRVDRYFNAEAAATIHCKVRTISIGISGTNTRATIGVQGVLRFKRARFMRTVLRDIKWRGAGILEAA